MIFSASADKRRRTSRQWSHFDRTCRPTRNFDDPQLWDFDEPPNYPGDLPVTHAMHATRKKRNRHMHARRAKESQQAKEAKRKPVDSPEASHASAWRMLQKEALHTDESFVEDVHESHQQSLLHRTATHKF